MVLGSTIVNQLAQILKSPDKQEYDLISQEIIANKFPIMQTTCLKDALTPFLSQCLRYGFETVDPLMRAETAMKLSLCEFDASGIKSIPQSCIEKGDDFLFMDCIAELETLPQWWTTYSGNYQHLQNICFENSLPYEKEQILDLFLNITDVYSDFYQNIIYQAHEASEKMKSQSQEDLNILKKTFKDTVNELEEIGCSKKENMEEAMKNLEDEIVYKFSKSLKSFETKFSETDGAILQSLNVVKQNFDQFIDHIDNYNIEEKIEQFQHNHLEQWNEMSEVATQSKYLQVTYLQEIDSLFEKLYNDVFFGVEKLSEHIEKSHDKTVRMRDDFNVIMYDSVLPCLKEELLPTLHDLSNTVLDRLELMDYIMTEKFQIWEDKIDGSLGNIDYHINSTLVKVEFLDEQIGSFQQKITLLINSLKLCFRFWKYLYDLIILNRKLLFLVTFTYGVYQQKSWVPLTYTKYWIIKYIIYAGIVFCSILLGSKLGCELSRITLLLNKHI